ncbi:MAG TPA: MerR family DNA-binding transcriptional regulator [Jiangellales bacterium]|nr:MerR family DNA-binding transcriptional regulator [Jiangellales bacterium]
MTTESLDAREQASGEDRRTWTIAEIARDFDVTLRTIRFYEEHGLVSPERRGRQRVFHPRDRIRLALVLRGKRLGFPLEEIKKIVDMYDAEPGEAGQLRYLLAQIGDRRRELEQRHRDLDEALAELGELERRCRDDLTRLT